MLRGACCHWANYYTSQPWIKRIWGGWFPYYPTHLGWLFGGLVSIIWPEFIFVWKKWVILISCPGYFSLLFLYWSRCYYFEMFVSIIQCLKLGSNLENTVMTLWNNSGGMCWTRFSRLYRSNALDSVLELLRDGSLYSEHTHIYWQCAHIEFTNQLLWVNCGSRSGNAQKTMTPKNKYKLSSNYIVSTAVRIDHPIRSQWYSMNEKLNFYLQTKDIVCVKTHENLFFAAIFLNTIHIHVLLL